MAARMASEDIENWSEEDRRKLQEIAKAKAKARLSYSGCYMFFIVERECFMFFISEEGFSIKKFQFDPMNQLNDEQIISKLREMGVKIFLIRECYASYINIVKKGVLKNSINEIEERNILSEYTVQQLLNKLYERDNKLEPYYSVRFN